MSSCTVVIDEKEYNGEYIIENEKIELDVYGYSSGLGCEYGTFVSHKSISIYDYRNKQFFYSPYFNYCGETYGLVQFEKFETSFYLTTSNHEGVKGIDTKNKIKDITFYHPMFSKFLRNNSLTIKHNEHNIACSLDTKSPVGIIQIQQQNIDRIEYGSVYNYKHRKDGQEVIIETQIYIQLIFEESIDLEDILQYVNEFDVFVNAYAPNGFRSFKNYVNFQSGITFSLTHDTIGREQYVKKAIRPLVNITFIEFLEKMYKNTNYRNSENRNKYLPLDFKKPTSLEDQFVYYFRYIDLYMGQLICNEEGKSPSSYDRISRFVDDNTDLFEYENIQNTENLKQEINSLRNHYVHEGYYLPNNEFAVKDKKRTVLYMKQMDYLWLYKLTRILKLGVYRILYTKVLEVEIDEWVLKHSNIK